MTKAQKKVKAAKSSKQRAAHYPTTLLVDYERIRRIAAALNKFVRSNPAMPAAFKKAKVLRIRRNKGGKSVTIRVVHVKEPKR